MQNQGYLHDIEMMGEKFDKNAPIAMQSDVFPDL